jgi:hypothetical protein
VEICTRCGKRPGVGFFDRTGLFVDNLSPEIIKALGFKAICRACAAVQVATSFDSGGRIGPDAGGNPEGDSESGSI